jgi:hypothetical protein
LRTTGQRRSAGTSWRGIIAVSTGAIASSVALIGFGVDSIVDTARGAIVGSRLRAELNGQGNEKRIED